MTGREESGAFGHIDRSVTTRSPRAETARQARETPPDIPPAPVDPRREGSTIEPQAEAPGGGPSRTSSSPGNWTVGVASHKGPVRSENQDRGEVFGIGHRQFVLVADGMGGLPHGEEAAQLAIQAARDFIHIIHDTERSWALPPLAWTAARAIHEAEKRLESQAREMGLSGPGCGLRSTLIVVAADGDEYGYAYLGDGGGLVLRATGERIDFLDPQKAPGAARNILACSLGPRIEGIPVVGSLARCAGDLLMVGTDGIFDLDLEEDFPRNVLALAISYQGDLARTARDLVEGLALQADDRGFVCHDNLTMALLGNGAPRIGRGFWSDVTHVTTGALTEITSATRGT